VTEDFHSVFTRVAVWSAEDGDKRLVDDFSAVFDAGKVDGIGCDGIAAYGTNGADG
jgi:hypothetical protein